MHASLEQYVSFLKTIPDAAILVDQNGRVVFANPLFCKMFQCKAESLKDQSVSQFVPSSVRPHHDDHIRHYAQAPAVRPMGKSLALSACRGKGELFPVDIMLSPVQLEHREYTLCVVRDLTLQREQEQQLQAALQRESELANTDALTGAANSRCLRQMLEREIQRCRRCSAPFTLTYIDLDNFKQVNDRWGHAEGDKLLQHVANVARQRLRANDVLARMGGDEFVILFPDTDLAASRTVVHRLVQRLKREMRAFKWPVTFSCGTVAFQHAPRSVDDALKAADQLMYKAKADRNTCHFAPFNGTETPLTAGSHANS